MQWKHPPAILRLSATAVLFSSRYLEHRLKQVKFESLPIAEPILKGIRDAGFEFCTPIQSKALPHSLKGKDIAGQAQTGTGKTAAFLIALFHRLVTTPPRKPERKGKEGPRALIIAPTRELARQIEKDALLLGSHCDQKVVCVYGGVDYEKQRNKIKAGVDILIATPGRLLDLREAVSVCIWAIKCKECRRWFFLCKGCFSGQRYCSDACRKVARRCQCREAQATYIAKRKGKLRRAAAAVAFRERERLGAVPRPVAAIRNRSTCRFVARSEAERFPCKTCCERCGRRGSVREWF